MRTEVNLWLNNKTCDSYNDFGTLFATENAVLRRQIQTSISVVIVVSFNLLIVRYILCLGLKTEEQYHAGFDTTKKPHHNGHQRQAYVKNE